MAKDIAHRIIDEALTGQGELNITKLSKDTTCTTVALWYYVRQERKWPVGVWLQTLVALGAAKFRGNTIIINTEEAQDLKEMTDKLRTTNYFK